MINWFILDANKGKASSITVLPMMLRKIKFIKNSVGSNTLNKSHIFIKNWI